MGPLHFYPRWSLFSLVRVILLDPSPVAALSLTVISWLVWEPVPECQTTSGVCFHVICWLQLPRVHLIPHWRQLLQGWSQAQIWPGHLWWSQAERRIPHLYRPVVSSPEESPGASILADLIAGNCPAHMKGVVLMIVPSEESSQLSIRKHCFYSSCNQGQYILYSPPKNPTIYWEQGQCHKSQVNCLLYKWRIETARIPDR